MVRISLIILAFVVALILSVVGIATYKPFQNWVGEILGNKIAEQILGKPEAKKLRKRVKQLPTQPEIYRQTKQALKVGKRK